MKRIIKNAKRTGGIPELKKEEKKVLRTASITGLTTKGGPEMIKAYEERQKKQAELRLRHAEYQKKRLEKKKADEALLTASQQPQITLSVQEPIFSQPVMVSSSPSNYPTEGKEHKQEYKPKLKQ